MRQSCIGVSKVSVKHQLPRAERAPTHPTLVGLLKQHRRNMEDAIFCAVKLILTYGDSSTVSKVHEIFKLLFHQCHPRHPHVFPQLSGDLN